jgi:hypothetical protein
MQVAQRVAIEQRLDTVEHCREQRTQGQQPVGRVDRAGPHPDPGAAADRSYLSEEAGLAESSATLDEDDRSFPSTGRGQRFSDDLQLGISAAERGPAYGGA